MKYINTEALINSCDALGRRCIEIAGTRHGSSWLFDQLMRMFEQSDALEAVTIPVFINAPVMSKGEATIGRDGSLQMYTVKEDSDVQTV